LAAYKNNGVLNKSNGRAMPEKQTWNFVQDSRERPEFNVLGRKLDFFNASVIAKDETMNQTECRRLTTLNRCDKLNEIKYRLADIRSKPPKPQEGGGGSYAAPPHRK
jgi:hypothetical protein